MTPDANANLTYTSLLTPISVTASAGVTGVDISGFIGRVVVRVKVGLASAGTNPTLAVKLQDSADDSTYADISGATASASATGAVALNENIVVDTRAVGKYLRVYHTIGGTSSPAFPVAYDLIGYKQVES